MPALMKCKIAYNQKIAPGIYLLGVRTSGELDYRPGRFFMLRATESLDPLLGRPLSWFRYFPKTRIIEFVYRVVGRGTELLSRRCAGDEITMIGPCGKGFDLRKAKGRMLLVAGGVGMPGLWSFCRRSWGSGKRDITLVWGAKSKEQFFMVRKIPKGIKFLPVTEDGSKGKKGLATDIVKVLIDQEGAPDIVYSCGPRAMLKELAKICAEHEIRGQVLYEERMACGVGACLGCAVPAAGGGYLRACHDGPAFWFEEIDWERVQW